MSISKEYEDRIIEFVADGLSNKEIGIEVGATENTIRNYLRVIYDKLGVWNRLELALWYISRKRSN